MEKKNALKLSPVTQGNIIEWESAMREKGKIPRTIEEKAIAWHIRWLKWAERNGVDDTEEYEVTECALNCLLKNQKEQRLSM